MANELEKKRAEEKESPVMLGVGLPARSARGRISEEDREFAEDYKRVTGEDLDLKELVRLRDLRNAEDRPWTRDDFPREDK